MNVKNQILKTIFNKTDIEERLNKEREKTETFFVSFILEYFDKKTVQVFVSAEENDTQILIDKLETDLDKISEEIELTGLMCYVGVRDNSDYLVPLLYRPIRLSSYRRVS